MKRLVCFSIGSCSECPDCEYDWTSRTSYCSNNDCGVGLITDDTLYGFPSECCLKEVQE